MKKTKEELLEKINSLSFDNVRQLAYAFLRIEEQVWRTFDENNSETRSREQARLKIAQKHISNYLKEYSN
jgi:DNA repair photolyase